MSIYSRMITAGELNMSNIVKAIKLSDYDREVIFAGLETGLLSNRQMINILKGVEERVFHDKDYISKRIVDKINFNGLSWEKKVYMIKETKHNIPMARKIVESIKWETLSPKKLEEAVRLSEYNYFVLIATLETGNLPTRMKFEAIKKVSGKGKSREKITETVIRVNHWGKMGVVDCCMAITLSGGDRKIAEKVRDQIDFTGMSLETILDIITLSDRHTVIMEAVREEMERRGI